MNIYEGNENYIFISYAHADTDKILPILEALDREKIRFWYDRGIEAGYEWPDYIAKQLDRSYKAIVFLTNNLLKSTNCKNEILYALHQNKEILMVYLEPVEAPPSMRLLLDSTPSLFAYKFSSTDQLISCIKSFESSAPPKKIPTEKNSVPVPKKQPETEIPKVEPPKSEPPKSEPPKSEPPVSAPIKPEATAQNTEPTKPRYQVFISYRRKGGDVVAKLICSELKNRGYSVFYDYDSLKGGYFDNSIIDAINNCTNFVLVLPKRALARCRNEKDWVRQEITCAINSNKNIIPVMLDGFEFPRRLPAEIESVSRFNGVRFDMAYLDAVIDKIIEKFKESQK